MTTTDQNNNPINLNLDLAIKGGLLNGEDYNLSTVFDTDAYSIAMIVLGDPVPRIIKVIDKIGFYDEEGYPRWTYISMPNFIWLSLTDEQKRDVIGFIYKHLGGNMMIGYFPNYEKL
jgi:hypothetical protein